MAFTIVAISYTLVAVLLAVVVFIRTPRRALSLFYIFCVGCLLFLLLAAIVLRMDVPNLLRYVILGGAEFLYAVLPFFFIHFVVLFARKYEVLRQRYSVPAIYLVAMVVYALVMFGYIPNPMTASGEVTDAGYVFYMTWLTLFFAIGIAMIYEIARGLYEKAMKGSVIYVGFLLLILVLPGPFTESIFSTLLHLKIGWYYYSSAAALIGAVYLVFRQRIIGATFSEAVKSSLGGLSDMFVILDPYLQIEMIRGMAVSSTLGYAENELVGRPFTNLFHDERKPDRHELLSMLDANKRANFDLDIVGHDGRLVPMNFSLSPYSVDGKLAGFVSIGRDMTERRKLEEELRQAQKLESIGTLAGGIAHDFNNILQIFHFNTVGLRNKVNDLARLEKSIEVNMQAVERGARLVQQILTFARKADVTMERVDLNSAIPEIVTMMTETVPKTISFEFVPGVNISPIEADKNQISQVIVNLVVNARDAMPTGGQIKISAEVVEARSVAERFPSPLDVPYVLVKVKDNGFGMDESTKQRVFEPFFTTKLLGKGTGLGLAVVYGIMKTHKGFVGVESAVGVGTTFSLYFPIQHTKPLAPKDLKPKIQEDVRGSESILIVEDEEDLLNELATVFSGHGYQVFTAKDGLEGIDVFRKNFRKISLLVTDLGLPVMNGWDACLRMKEVNPALHVVVISGYLDPEMLSEKREEGMDIVITKPFDLYHLLWVVRKVLDGVSVTEELVPS